MRRGAIHPLGQIGKVLPRFSKPAPSLAPDLPDKVAVSGVDKIGMLLVGCLRGLKPYKTIGSLIFEKFNAQNAAK